MLKTHSNVQPKNCAYSYQFHKSDFVCYINLPYLFSILGFLCFLELILSNQVDCHYRALDEILNKALNRTKNKDCDCVYKIY